MARKKQKGRARSLPRRDARGQFSKHGQHVVKRGKLVKIGPPRKSPKKKPAREIEIKTLEEFYEAFDDATEFEAEDYEDSPDYGEDSDA